MTEKTDEPQIDEEMAGVADEYEGIEMEEDTETVKAESDLPVDDSETSSPVLDDGGPFDDLPDESLNQIDDPYDPMADVSDTTQTESEAEPVKETVDEIRVDKKDTGKRAKAKASGQKGKFSLMSGKMMLAVGGTLTLAVLATIALAPGSPTNNDMAQQEPGLSFDAPDATMAQTGDQAPMPVDSMDPFAGDPVGQPVTDQFGLLDTADQASPSANPNFDPVLAQEFCDPAKPQNIDIYLCTDMGVDTSALEVAMGGIASESSLDNQPPMGGVSEPLPAPTQAPATVPTSAAVSDPASSTPAQSSVDTDNSAVVISTLTQDIERLKAELASAKASANQSAGEPVLSDSEMAKELKDLRHKNKLYIEENGRFKTRIAKLESDLKGQSSYGGNTSRSVSSTVNQDSFDIKGWTLSGVTGNVALFKSASGESFVVREGEMVDGFRIIEIDSTNLVVKTSGGTVRLR